MQDKLVEDTLLQQGFELMLFGMGTVFVFLTLLVIATAIMSRLVQKFFPELELETPATAAAAPSGATDPKLIAIIKAAIDQHRGKK